MSRSVLVLEYSTDIVHADGLDQIVSIIFYDIVPSPTYIFLTDYNKIRNILKKTMKFIKKLIE